jgi:ubiquinone/menaquinone biosynthesis C-methylase UbiE
MNFDIAENYQLTLKTSGFDIAFGDGLKRIVRLAQAVLTGKGIDIGSAFFHEHREPLPGAHPVDPAIPNTGSATDLSRFAAGAMDFVFCSHTLEHVDNPELACLEARRVLKRGGRYFLYLPFPGHPHWDPAVSKDVRYEHKWQPDPLNVGRLLLITGFSVWYMETAKDDLWSFVAIGEKQ